jgi:hypothetical protein
MVRSAVRYGFQMLLEGAEVWLMRHFDRGRTRVGSCAVCRRDVRSDDDHLRSNGDLFHRDCFARGAEEPVYHRLYDEERTGLVRIASER